MLPAIGSDQTLDAPRVLKGSKSSAALPPWPRASAFQVLQFYSERTGNRRCQGTKLKEFVSGISPSKAVCPQLSQMGQVMAATAVPAATSEARGQSARRAGGWRGGVWSCFGAKGALHLPRGPAGSQPGQAAARSRRSSAARQADVPRHAERGGASQRQAGAGGLNPRLPKLHREPC
jgi:hypothetical protein